VVIVDQEVLMDQVVLMGHHLVLMGPRPSDFMDHKKEVTVERKIVTQVLIL